MSTHRTSGAVDGSSHAAHEAHSAATVSENLCEGLNKMVLYGHADLTNLAQLAAMPPEIVLNILAALEENRDWLALARTCRRLSNVAVPELDKYAVTAGEYYAVWYACAASKPAILLRHIALDPAVVDRYFARSFYHEGAGSAFGRDMTPLAVAAVAGRDAIVRLLLAHGADANRPDRRPVLENAVLWYPINWAVACEHESSVSIIRMLNAHSANVNQVPVDLTDSATECARGIKCAPIFRVLMLQTPHADPLRRSQSTSCETYNNDLRRQQSVRLHQLVALLENGADPNQRYDWDFVTPIFFLLTSLATYSPSFYFSDRLMLSHEADDQARLVNEIAVSFLDTLRDFGADVFKLGNVYFYRQRLARSISAAWLETPLHAACRLNDRHKPIIHWFLRNGASINSLGKAKSTPLMAYCGSKFTDVEQFRQFLKCAPSINHQDILGRTALHDLCDNDELRPQVKEKAVRMLLNRGADPTILSNEGRVPGQGIESTGTRITPYEDVLLMLREATEKWEARRRKSEKREREKTKGGTSSGSRSRTGADIAGDVHSRGDASGGERKRNQDDGHDDKQTPFLTGKAADARGQSHITMRGDNRTNGEGYQRRGQSNTRRNPRNCSRNRPKDQRHGRQNILPETRDGIRPVDNPAVPRRGFYDHIHGGRYSSGPPRDDQRDNRSDNRAGYRGNSRGYRGSSSRGHRGAHQSGSRGFSQAEIPENPEWGSTENMPSAGYQQSRGHRARPF
ncbi:hypothetical protein F5Y10DRAFT_250467 [Nemania abortiva]|nr:hypothetical protein F5Y10DRAFT_250467 [Nemania abortiva]